MVPIDRGPASDISCVRLRVGFTRFYSVLLSFTQFWSDGKGRRPTRSANESVMQYLP